MGKDAAHCLSFFKHWSFRITKINGIIKAMMPLKYSH
jgi:hypothetical protein